ncbi:hypothetical protein ERO13_D10G197800v2 [Gossypium hirsutum]|uniref:Uncharacterized protein n=3 Tax=Gossypium TaxID=3633 RepID=A0A0D2RR50_GOSRA|nr:hypothetical protein ES319_D10G222400v1 [Gossypium barbadense]KAG4127091.1 hypothetical protein ERO13_D10G197800v2 [Gossypium hirsutum]KJB73202.1 hypothetical protein B456_011G221500 [Gossypium raimondii]TYI62162.1 hypothetical protein E1A91_D10G226700v1 [Gossypium mustelinum]
MQCTAIVFRSTFSSTDTEFGPQCNIKVDGKAQHLDFHSSAKPNFSFKIPHSCKQAATWCCRCVFEINIRQHPTPQTRNEANWS